MTVIIKNNAVGFLAIVAAANSTSITLRAQDVAQFPVLTAGQYFYLTLTAPSGATEIVRVTATAAEVFTVVRTAPSYEFVAGSKAELRVTAEAIQDYVADAIDAFPVIDPEDLIRSSAIYRIYRPGDAGELFDLDTATVAVNTFGGVARFTQAGRLAARFPTAIEEGRTYTVRFAYSRSKDSNDPANDGLRFGVDLLNGFGNKIGEQLLASDNTLLALTGRRTVEETIARAAGAGIDFVLPTAVRYVRAWVQVYGQNHQTDIEVCGVEDERVAGPQGAAGPSAQITVSGAPAIARTFYVTMTGNDANDGTTLYAPLATVNAAVAKLVALGQPGIAIVHPGDYVVQPDTVIPANGTLYGYDLRATKLSLPSGQQVNNMFQLDSGAKVRGFTFSNLQHELPPSYISTVAGLAAVAERAYFTVAGVLYRKMSGVATLAGHDYPPEKGFAFVFKPGAVITRSPYISDCSQLHNFTQDQMTIAINKATGNPLMPRGGGNLMADGAVLAPSSPLRSVVVDSFTAINPNGVGYLMRRNAFVQLVSVFTNWSRIGLWCHDGGQVTVANSNNTFGDYAFVSTGFRNVVSIPSTVAGAPIAVYTPAADQITTDATAIINEMYIQLASEFVAVSGSSDANGNGSYLYNSTTLRYNNTNNWHFIKSGGLWLLRNASDVTQATQTSAGDLANPRLVTTWNGVLSAGTVQGFTLEQETLTRRDAGTFLRELADDLRSGQDRGARFFVNGMFDWNAQYVFAASLLTVFNRAFDILVARVKTRPSLIIDPAVPMIDYLVALIKTNLTTPPRVGFSSVIEANSQQFSYAGTGVNYNALPTSQRGTGVAGNPLLAILKLDGGRVYATFSTEVGDTYLGEDLRIDFERSTIEGQAFSRGVQNIALPLIIGIGG